MILENKKVVFAGLSVLLVIAIFLNVKTYEEVVVSSNLALKHASNVTRFKSNYLKNHFEKSEARLSTLKNMFLSLDKLDQFDRNIVSDVLYSNLSRIENMLSIWFYLEPNAMDIDSLHIDEMGSLPSGRFAPWLYYDRNNKSIVQNVCSSDQLKFYTLPKKLKRTVLMEPYQTENGGEDTYFITIAEPIIQDGFKGVIGTDWFWEDFNKIMCERPLGDRGNSYLISKSGIILSHENKYLLGGKIDSLLFNQIRELDNEKIAINHIGNEGFYRVITKMDLQYTENEWYLINEIPDSNDFFAVIQSSKVTWRVGLILLVLILSLVFGAVYLIDLLREDRNKLSRQLKGTLNSSFEGIVLFDREYKYQRINEEYAKAIQYLYDVEIKVGDDISKGLTEEFASYMKGNLDKAFNGSHFIDELKVKKHKFRYYFNPFFNEFSDLEGVMLRVIDITRLSKDREELDNYRKNLESMVTERTKELQAVIDRLKDTRVKLVENEKIATLGLLSSGLANEISNPLNFIAGNITPLKKDMDEVSEIIDFVNKNLNDEEKVRDLLGDVEPDILIPEINALIDGIEKGTSRVKELIFNFNEIVRPDRQARFENVNRGIKLTLEFLQSRIPNNVEVITELDPNLPSTYCDMGKLSNAFLSLIWCAIEKIDQNGFIRINSYSENEIIHVGIYSDSEVITKEEEEVIFNPSIDVNSDSSLGLAICKTVIEAHGGSLLINNEVGKGFTFIMKIPILLQSQSY